MRIATLLIVLCLVGCGDSEYKIASDTFLADKAAYESLDNEVKDFEKRIAALPQEMRSEMRAELAPLVKQRDEAKASMDASMTKMQSLKP